MEQVEVVIESCRAYFFRRLCSCRPKQSLLVPHNAASHSHPPFSAMHNIFLSRSSLLTSSSSPCSAFFGPPAVAGELRRLRRASKMEPSSYALQVRILTTSSPPIPSLHFGTSTTTILTELRLKNGQNSPSSFWTVRQMGSHLASTFFAPP